MYLNIVYSFIGNGAACGYAAFGRSAAVFPKLLHKQEGSNLSTVLRIKNSPRTCQNTIAEMWLSRLCTNFLVYPVDRNFIHTFKEQEIVCRDTLISEVTRVLVCNYAHRYSFICAFTFSLERETDLPTEEASEMFRFIKYEDEREVFGFQVHSFSTFDKVKKYDETDTLKSAEKLYSIKVSETKRMINLYAVASTKFEIAC